MIKRFLLASIITMLGAAQNTYAENIKGVIVPVIGHSNNISPGAGVAQKGDIIFSQKLIAQKTAKLTQPFYLQRDNSFDSRYDLKTDDLLYRVIFPKYEAAYCSIAHGFSQKPKIGKKWNSQICLIDRDKDGKFDLEFAGATRKFKLSPLSLNILWSKDLGIEPLPFTEFGAQSDASVEARVELTKLSTSKAKFKVLIQLIEGDWVEHGKESIKFDKDAKLPITVDVYGAKIQINTNDGSSINYEVVSGFSQTDPILLK